MVLFKREVGRSDRRQHDVKSRVLMTLACWFYRKEPGSKEYEECGSRSCTKVGKRIVSWSLWEDPAMPEP